MKKSIIYDGYVDVRFSDLDPYNHVNFNLYPEYVITTRWHYTKKVFGMEPNDWVIQNLGFFIKEVNTRYKKPIMGTQRVYCSSFVAKHEGPQIFVEFEIRNEDKSTLYAQGGFTFVSMDLKAQRPISLPDWSEKYFFEADAP